MLSSCLPPWCCFGISLLATWEKIYIINTTMFCSMDEWLRKTGNAFKKRGRIFGNHNHDPIAERQRKELNGNVYVFGKLKTKWDAPKGVPQKSSESDETPCDYAFGIFEFYLPIKWTRWHLVRFPARSLQSISPTLSHLSFRSLFLFSRNNLRYPSVRIAFFLKLKTIKNRDVK